MPIPQAIRATRMQRSSEFPTRGKGACSRYSALLVHEPVPTRAGFRHRDAAGTQVLAWSRVRRALAAEVGEPQGVCTVVFDLVLHGPDAERVEALRFDAEPGEAAVAVARELSVWLAPERLAASIKLLASEGLAEEWHPDLESFEEHALAALAASGPQAPKARAASRRRAKAGPR